MSEATHLGHAPGALAALKKFETSGRLRRPAESLHTTGDPIIPFWQRTLYRAKVLDFRMRHLSMDFRLSVTGTARSREPKSCGAGNGRKFGYAAVIR